MAINTRAKKSPTDVETKLGCVWVAVIVVSGLLIWGVHSVIYQPPAEIVAHQSEYVSTCPAQRNLSGDNTSSFHPYIMGKIAVIDKVNGKISDVNADDSLDALRANDPKEVETVICLYFRDNIVGQYDNGTNAIQEECDVIVIDKAKNLTVGEATIDGPYPPESATRSDTDTSGGPVAQSDIVNYILSLPGAVRPTVESWTAYIMPSLVGLVIVVIGILSIISVAVWGSAKVRSAGRVPYVPPISKTTKEQWFDEGNAHRNTGRYQEAIAAYNRVIALDPNYALAYNNRGAAYYALKKYQEAIADFDHAIALDSRLAQAYNNRGNAYVPLKKYQEAIADFDHAIALNPNFTLAYKNRDAASRALNRC